MWITFVCVRTSTHVTTLDVSPLVSNSAIAQNRIAQKVCQWKSRHACWLITRWFKWRSQFNGHGLFCREGKKQFAGRRPSQQLHVVVLSAEDSGRSHHEEDDSFLKSNTNWNIWVQLLGLSHSSTSCVMLGYTACSSVAWRPRGRSIWGTPLPSPPPPPMAILLTSPPPL